MEDYFKTWFVLKQFIDGLIPTYLLPYLRQKGKRQPSKETRGHFNVGKSISQRLLNIKKRNSLDHWEAGTVVSSRVQSKGCLATFTERKSRYYICFLISDCSSKSMKVAIKQFISPLPNNEKRLL